MSCTLPDCAIPGEFNSIDAAAFAGFEELRRQLDWQIREHAGCIFEVRPGVFRASHPARLKNPALSRNFCRTPPAPLGTRMVADYHNHPRIEGFSPIDKESIPAVPHYLLAPSGVVYRYTPATQATERWESGQWIPA